MSFHAILSQAGIRVTTSHARLGPVVALQRFLTPAPAPSKSKLPPYAQRPYTPISADLFPPAILQSRGSHSFRSGRGPEGPCRSPRVWRGCPVRRCIASGVHRGGVANKAASTRRLDRVCAGFRLPELNGRESSCWVTRCSVVVVV